MAVILVGCSSAPPKDDGPDTVENQHTLTEDDQRIQLPGPNAAPPRPAEVEEDEREVEVFAVAMNQTYRTLAGIEINLLDFAGSPKGATMSMEFVSGEDILQLRMQDQNYAEGMAFGSLYTLSVTGDDVMVSMSRDAPSAPIDVASASKIAIQNFRERPECQGATQMSSRGEATGTLLVMALEGEAVKCSARVGLYTGRIVD